MSLVLKDMILEIKISIDIMENNRIITQKLKQDDKGGKFAVRTMILKGKTIRNNE